MSVKVIAYCPKDTSPDKKKHCKIEITFEPHITREQAETLWKLRAKRLPTGYPPVCPICNTPMTIEWT